MAQFNIRDLEAYLDEALDPAEMAAVELALRNDKALLKQLSDINRRRDAGVHTLGEIWRRHRLTCPTRETLGGFLLDALTSEETDYVHFHLQQVGCRLCRANLEDLQREHAEAKEEIASRRKRYFQSSVKFVTDEED
ncbi:MAG: hypothetical protein NXI22_07695 [bacterium]|nr:hypothetical protein [bacterium]